MEALERVAYLLDRGHASPHRARAFLRAAAVLRSLPAGELSQRARTGRLTELEGLGPTTAGVAAEAANGAVPGYLAELEETTRIERPPGDELAAALRGDCHSHSTWSDGGAEIEAMAAAARALGHEYLALTDHSPRLRVARGLSADRLRRQLEVVAGLNDRLADEAGSGRVPPFRVLTGIEVDILDDGSLDQDEGLLAGLDLVVASVHSKLGMDERSMTARLATAVANPHVDVLGHCTGRLLAGRGPGRGPGRGRPGARFDAELVFHACERFDTAVEVNCRPERLDPPRSLLALAVELGCRFAIDTDAHAPGQLEWQPYGTERAASCAVEVDRVVNAWPAEQLLAWTAAHGS